MEEIVKGLSGQYGVIFLLVLVIGTGIAGKWVFRWVMDATVMDRDKQLAEAHRRAERWETIALKALKVGEKAVDKAVDKESE